MQENTLKNFVDDMEDLIPAKNDSGYERILAIGDIHGKYKKFISLWNKLSVTENDLVIFLGDYIDRGEGVAEILEWVMTQPKNKNLKFLKGNHEKFMLDALTDNGREFLEKICTGKIKTLTYQNIAGNEDAICWIQNGGGKTFLAMKDLESKSKFTIDEILKFAEKLPLYHLMKIDGRNYFFCHAGVKPGVPLDKQSEENLLWIREEFFNYYEGEDIIISGHSPLQMFFDFEGESPHPVRVPDRNILMIDTGSFVKGGYISCVDILSGEYWQSDKEEINYF